MLRLLRRALSSLVQGVFGITIELAAVGALFVVAAVMAFALTRAF